MEHLTVTFYARVYRETRTNKKGFNIPKELADLLGLKRQSPVALVITRSSGELVFHGTGKVTSGTEITQVRICRRLQYAETIRVSASRPPMGSTKV
jgi:hypothetical protein